MTTTQNPTAPGAVIRRVADDTEPIGSLLVNPGGPGASGYDLIADSALAVVGEPVSAANYNDPKQTVIAGSKAAVDKACEVLKGLGAKRALPLPVSAPFHSSLMKPAAERLKAALADIDLAAPRIPVVNNVDVAVESDPARIRDALVRQAAGPVRWVECVQAIRARGITHVIECGPGKALAGMTKRIDAELVGASLYDPATLAEVKALLA